MITIADRAELRQLIDGAISAVYVLTTVALTGPGRHRLRRVLHYPAARHWGQDERDLLDELGIEMPEDGA
jgi:hypothetical protein